jgi:hypothetical protein
LLDVLLLLLELLIFEADILESLLGSREGTVRQRSRKTGISGAVKTVSSRRGLIGIDGRAGRDVL